MAERKYYTAEKKAEIIMKVIGDGKAISEVAEEYEIHPNQIYEWKKQLLEGATSIFKVNRTDITSRKEEKELKEEASSISVEPLDFSSRQDN